MFIPEALINLIYLEKAKIDRILDNDRVVKCWVNRGTEILYGDQDEEYEEYEEGEEEYEEYEEYDEDSDGDDEDDEDDEDE